MHVRELVEMAGIVAYNGPLLIRAEQPLSQSHLEGYWTASKCRFESWHRALKRHVQSLAQYPAETSDRWIELRAVLDEIFASEILTRVWTAVLAARDRRIGASADDPLATNVLDSHVEARRRALALLLDSRVFSTRQAVVVNRLRRRAEKWTDLLIGGLLGECDLRRFAFDRERAEDFADDLARRSSLSGRQAWRLSLVSLHSAFQQGLCPLPANPEANARIVAGILGCFPGELFDSTGVFKSLWMVRLSAMTSDTQGMIDDLLQAPARPDLSRSRLR